MIFSFGTRTKLMYRSVKSENMVSELERLSRHTEKDVLKKA